MALIAPVMNTFTNELSMGVCQGWKTSNQNITPFSISKGINIFNILFGQEWTEIVIVTLSFPAESITNPIENSTAHS